MRVAVLAGGWSPERDISLKSAENISEAFKDLGHEVFLIDIKRDLRFITSELYSVDPDFIFNSLHGTGGEDGVIQGVLQIFGRPYSGSGVLSSAICFNKDIAKKLVQMAGVRVPHWVLTAELDLNSMIEPPIPYPFFVKPVSNGSSIGAFLISNDQGFSDLKETKWRFGPEIMFEEYIHGREFTVFVESGKSVGALEITFENDFFDYFSKYTSGASKHVNDFQMPKNDKEEMLHMAELAYSSCLCSGGVRIDFRYNGTLYFLEINTQSGTTKHSLVPDILRFSNDSLVEFARRSILNANVAD